MALGQYLGQVLQNLSELTPEGRIRANDRRAEADRQNTADLMRQRLNLEQQNSDRQFQRETDLDKQNTSNQEFSHQMQLGKDVASGTVRPVQSAPGSDAMPSSDELEQLSGRPTISTPGNPVQKYFFATPEEQDTHALSRAASAAAAQKELSDKTFKDSLNGLDPEFVKRNQDTIDSIKLHHTFGWTPPEESTDKLMARLYATGDADKIDRANKIASAKHPATGATGIALTPEALDNAAKGYFTTGQMPAFGMGKDAVEKRLMVMNRAAELNPGGIDLASNAAAYKANEESLKKNLFASDQLDTFERTGGKNMDLFLDKASKVIDSGSPWLNTPLRDINEKALGDSDVPAFQAARQVMVNEFAKLTNLANSGVLSDTARKEVESFNPANATMEQLYKVSQVLRQDAKNRTDETHRTISDISNRLHLGADGLKNFKGTGAAAETPTASAPPPNTPVVHANPTNVQAAPPAPPPLPAKKGDVASPDIVRQYFEASGHDKDKTRQNLTTAGWTIPTKQ